MTFPTAVQDVDEFFDALASYSVTDYMSQSFFSTASTVFGEVRDRPLSLNSESLLPLEDNSTQFAANEMPPSIQIQVEVIALELWLACRSKLIGSEDPWYMRLNMRGTSLRQVTYFNQTFEEVYLQLELLAWLIMVISFIDILCRTFRAHGRHQSSPLIFRNTLQLKQTNQSFTILVSSRLCMKSLRHTVTCHLLVSISAVSVPMRRRATFLVPLHYLSCSMTLSAEERAFADTIRRLEHLKLADRNFWRPPDNYEVIAAVLLASAPFAKTYSKPTNH